MTRENTPGEIPAYQRPSQGKQDAFWLLRASLTKAVRQNWDAVLDACPEIAAADAALQLYLYRNHRLRFQVFRPEDLKTTLKDGEGTWLR